MARWPKAPGELEGFIAHDKTGESVVCVCVVCTACVFMGCVDDVKIE